MLQKLPYKSRKTHIKVFVTKNLRFRAKIQEPTGVSYEVTIGGAEWSKGKGREHEDRIRKKCELIVSYLDARMMVFEKNAEKSMAKQLHRN